jgi:DNA-directed RNA polymerase I, II, and III subunit RPABC1
VEGLADREGDDERAGALRMRLTMPSSVALTLPKGYLVIEDDMTLPLDQFAQKYAREDGEPEYVATSCDSASGPCRPY